MDIWTQMVRLACATLIVLSLAACAPLPEPIRPPAPTATPLQAIVTATATTEPPAPTATPLPARATATATAEPRALPSPVPAVTPVVIDTDMGTDDVMAILFLLQRPDVRVVAVTVSGTGLAHCGPGTRNALSLISLADAGAIPVACGRERPLQGDHVFPKEWREGADSFFGLQLPQAGRVSDKSAAELIATSVKAAGQRAVLVALGPLTNVAEALQSDPSLAGNLEMIYIMGGAIAVPGNVMSVPLTAPNTTAEFNMFVDPRAANIVLNSGAPLTLVPLDATNQVPIARNFYRALKEQHGTAAAGFVYQLFEANPFLYQGSNYFWDPLAAAISVDESLATFEEKTVHVVEEEGPEVGRTTVTGGGMPVRVAMSADAARFETEFLSTLNGGKAVTIDRSPPPVSLAVTQTGDKCSYEGPDEVPAGEVAIDWSVDRERQVYGIAVVTLDEGKTLADLDAWPTTDAPPWLQLVAFQSAQPGARTTLIVEVKDRPIYVVCFTAYPEAKVGSLGPVKVRR